MELKDRVALVTGGGNGIGRALALAFAGEGASAVVVVDRDEEAAAQVAASLPGGVGMALRADVTDEGDVRRAVEAAEKAFGRINLCCANAGVAGPGGVEAPDALWQKLWEVHVMGHVYLARAVLPGMVARGEGYLVHTASAAGLLTALGNVPYAVTKRATVALAEWLAITYGDQGIRVSCVCPLGVATDMLASTLDDVGGASVLASGDVIEPEAVAAAVVDAVRDERFFVLPHPEVEEYVRVKSEQPERWLGGMRRLQARLSATS